MDEKAKNELLAMLFKNGIDSENDPEYQKIAEAEKREAEKSAKEYWAQKQSAANIPLRYKGCTFEAIEKKGIPQDSNPLFDEAKEYAGKFKERSKEGCGLIFAGSPGRLKTSLAVAVMQEVMKQGDNVFFISMPELLDTLEGLSRNRNREELVKFEEKIRNVKLLVLDDFGAEYPSGWVLNKVDAIITARYNNLKPIIITTNLAPAEMKERYVSRVIDRLRSAYTMVIAEGDSLREQGKVIKA